MSPNASYKPDDTVTGASFGLGAAAARHRLHLVHGPRPAPPGWPIEIDGPRTLGRLGGDADVALDDPRTSRQHATIQPLPNQLLCGVEDLGSKNGTFVDGKRVRRMTALGGGEVVRMGDTLFVYAQESPVEGDADAANDLILGTSAAIGAVRAEIALAATWDKTVLLLGESGTGKELAARAVHRLSKRSGPFVDLNCGAIPNELIEATLFGARRGAFTGAVADREGFFAAAHAGTLFLDEVGELPADAQPTLLRVLEDGRITAVGSTRARTVDVRVVAATNVVLEDAVHRGAFRRDLLARLHQWPVHLPPLRARRMDIPILLRHFVPHTRFSANAMEALLLAPWPDNVRGLRNVVERAATRAQGRPVEPTHLPPELLEPMKEREAPTPRREAAPDKNALENLLRVHDCNVSAVARDLGRTRKQIYRWIERFQIDLDALR